MGGRCGSRRSGSDRRPTAGRPRGPGADDQAQYRVLIYSHDSFGLGHLRRCRTIAHSLVAHHKKLNVLILSGSPIIGRFSFRARVDFVRVPGIIKRRNGEYTSLNLDFHVEQTLALRASIIEHTARVFRPDLFLVDKEPLGLLGEVRSTLRAPDAARGARGSSSGSATSWTTRRRSPRSGGASASSRRSSASTTRSGSTGCRRSTTRSRPTASPPTVAAKTRFTGYLPRETNPDVHPARGGPGHGPAGALPPGDPGRRRGRRRSSSTRRSAPTSGSTAGSRGRRSSSTGRSCRRRERAAFERRAARLPRVTTLEFHEHLENLVEKAAGVVCLGGYNTFCEILSLKKRSLIVPRVTPRAEQLLRARAAAGLGLAQTLDPDRLTPETLAEAIIHLPEQSPPATHRVPGLLDGLRFINQAVGEVARPKRRRGRGSAGCRRAGAAPARLPPGEPSEPLHRRPRPCGPRPPRRWSSSSSRATPASRRRSSRTSWPRSSGAGSRSTSSRSGAPTIASRTPSTRRPGARSRYLPEYLHEAPGRVLAGHARALGARPAATSGRSACGSATSGAIRRRTAAGASARPASSPPSCRPTPRTSTPTSFTRRPPSRATRRPMRGLEYSLVRAREGRLDDAGLGAPGEARGGALHRDLHGGRPGPPGRARPRARGARLPRARPAGSSRHRRRSGSQRDGSRPAGSGAPPRRGPLPAQEGLPDPLRGRGAGAGPDPAHRGGLRPARGRPPRPCRGARPGESGHLGGRPRSAGGPGTVPRERSAPSLRPRSRPTATATGCRTSSSRRSPRDCRSSPRAPRRSPSW